MERGIESAEYVEFANEPTRKEAHSSGIAWGAVIGGAVVAAALYLILLALGAGLGLSAISPWSSVGRHSQSFRECGRHRRGCMLSCPARDPSHPQ